MRFLKLVSMLALAAAPVVLAQTPTEKAAENPSTMERPTATKPPIKAQSDAEIVALVMALDDNEIGAANAVMKENVDPKILDLAKTIEQDHSQDKDQTQQLASKIGVEPKTTTAVDDLRSKGREALESLNAKQGRSLEDEFVSDMVKGHREALTMLDGFIASAQSPELKTHLTDARQHVAMHLEQAQQIQTSEPGTR